MSDEDTTIADLKDSIAEFCAERDWDQFHNSKDLAIGIVTEASELLERFRFKTPEQIDELMSGPGREGVVEELCDTMYFILRFAHMNGIDLSESMKAKLAKNAEKYPVSLAKGCNKKYDEYRGRPMAPSCPHDSPHMACGARRDMRKSSGTLPAASASSLFISSILHLMRYAVEADIPQMSAAFLTLNPST